MQLSFQEDAIFLVREKVAGGTSIKEMSSCNEQGRTGRRPRCIRQSITKKMEGWKAINSASAQPGWDDEGPKSGPLLFAKASEAGIAQTEKGRSRSSSKIHDSCSVLHMKDGPISSAREARREEGTSKGQIHSIHSNSASFQEMPRQDTMAKVLWQWHFYSPNAQNMFVVDFF